MRKSGAIPAQPRYCDHDEITLSHCKTARFVGRRESRMTESQDTVHGFEVFSYEGMGALFLCPLKIKYLYIINLLVL